MSAQTSKLSQKDYLKKYLSGGDDKKKKKKKKPKSSAPVISTKVRLIDDDIDLSKLQPLDDSALDLYEVNEDAPQIAGIVDERPADVQALDHYKQSQRWKVLSNPDGDGISVSQSGASKSVVNVNLSDEEDEFNIRPSSKVPQGKNMKSSKSAKYSKDSDESPPRNKRQDNSDTSPPRKGRQYDSDASPPRKGRQYNSDASPPRKRHDRDSHLSPARRRKQEDSDTSPPRKRRQNDSDTSPPRRRRQDDSDASPPRKRRQDKSSPRGRRQDNTDMSPPRKRCSNDSDESPPRKRKQSESYKSEQGKREGTQSRKKSQAYSDMSPPRRTSIKMERTAEESRSGKEIRHKNEGKMKSTLDGKVAGLQDAKKLTQEMLEVRKRENEAFEKMDDSISGRGAVAVKRDRKTGLKRDLELEQAEQRAKDEKENKHKEKYTRWGKGLKQSEEQQDRLAKDLYEMSKPLARYADDEDLERHLREQEREGDPMLEYLRSKTKDESKSKVPIYQGSFPPNRYNLRPGYRWDGVDRSNGYEKKRFESMNAKKAIEEDAYKWSTSDM